MSAPSSEQSCAQTAAVERLAEFIDALCAALMAELAPRSWLGMAWGRWVSRPLAERICGTLRGLGDRLREIAAEVLSADAPVAMCAGGGSREREKVRAPSGVPSSGVESSGVARVSAAPRGDFGAASPTAHDAPLMRPTASGSGSAEMSQRRGTGFNPPLSRVEPTTSRHRLVTHRPLTAGLRCLAMTLDGTALLRRQQRHASSADVARRDLTFVVRTGDVFLPHEAAARSHEHFVAISQ